MVVDIFGCRWVVVDGGRHIYARGWWWWMAIGGGGVVVDILWLVVDAGG